MATREAACHCGQLRLGGDSFAVSICHCLACQRRTGSAFGMQAGFKADQVQIAGRFNDYTRVSDEADRKAHVFHFCPDFGSQVFYTEPDEPDRIVVSVGSFADPSFPPPTNSGYDSRRHPWVGLPDSIQRFAPEPWTRSRREIERRRDQQPVTLALGGFVSHDAHPDRDQFDGDRDPALDPTVRDGRPTFRSCAARRSLPSRRGRRPPAPDRCPR